MVSFALPQGCQANIWKRNKINRTAIRIHLINEDSDLNVVSDRCRMVSRSCLRLVAAANAVGKNYEEGATLADELVKLIRWRFRKTSALGDFFWFNTWRIEKELLEQNDAFTKMIHRLVFQRKTCTLKWHIHQNDTFGSQKVFETLKWYTHFSV